ncbi:ribosome maturation factor RimP [Oerskovia flava]|uniref:ribosome maturation factor RimP n=1 Tax=Oerskovia flava TaxID=2986422 RepID=UPI0022400450|nr:ribosome maturation factor RimP [Oerskovia sp. JB1-3-2]
MARHAGADAIRDHLEPLVRDADLHLEDVTVTKAGAWSVVRVVLDLPEDATGSLDLDAVAEVSREISTALDALDVVPGQYTLEVTTPGTSRPLTETRHFKRARGRLVRLVRSDGSELTGRLLDVVDDALVLDGAPAVPVADVVRGEVQVELKRVHEADLGDENSGADGSDDEEV